MKRFGLKKKLFIGFSSASIFISMMVGFSLFRTASRIYYHSFVENKKALIQHLASAVDGDMHKKFNTPQSLKDPDFKRTLKFLKEANAREQNITWIYTIAYNDAGKLAYYVDATVIQNTSVWLESDVFGTLIYLDEKDELVLEWDSEKIKDSVETELNGKTCRIKLVNGAEPYAEVEGVKAFSIVNRKPLTIEANGKILTGNDIWTRTENIPSCVSRLKYSFGYPEYSTVPGDEWEENEDFKQNMKNVIKTGTVYFPENHEKVIYGTFINAIAPIFDSKGNSVAGLILSISVKDIRNFNSALTGVALSVSVLCLVLSLILSYFLSNYFTKPLKSLTDAVTEIASGELEKRADLKTNDEFEDLSISFNSMVENLKFAMDNANILNEELLQANRLKDEFLANTSHELRTPLNGIIGIAESLMEGAAGEVSSEMSRNLNMITVSGKRLSSLINDILDFSKMTHNALKLELVPMDLHSVVDVVLKLSFSLTKNKVLELKNSVSPETMPVLADENRLIQIFHNLIGNAIKFTDSGAIEVSAVELENMVRVEVSDTGIGIAQNHIRDIFRPFEQGDGSVSRQYGGTGLGLAVTSQLVELHSGKIWAESEPGKGSRFYFTLQIADSADSEKVKKLNFDIHPEPINPDNSAEINRIYNNEKIKPRDSWKLNGRDQTKILIVDDDPINLQVLHNYLELNDYSVTRANNGMEALELISREMDQFDLVILDVMMPKLSGYEVCAKVREDFSAAKLPVILLTAKNQLNDLLEGFESGANDYLTKPVSKGELFSRIKVHLENAMINKSLTRFVPMEFLEILGKQSILEVNLGDQVQKKMSVLFSDIRSFTALSETMTPWENFNFINSYLKNVSPVVRSRRGFIDKFIGDAIMALFPENGTDALYCGIDMLNAVKEYNGFRKKSGYVPIKIGIGVHYCPLTMGIVGEQKRIEGTVISDGVNLASRLEGLTKTYGIPFIFSESLIEDALKADDLYFRYLGQVSIKGKSVPQKIYELFNADEPDQIEKKLKTKDKFEYALNLFFNGNSSDSEKIFKEILMINNDDFVCQYYLNQR